MKGVHCKMEGSGEAVGGTEISSRAIPCETKRLFVDLKENERGRFIKVSEVDSAGRKVKIFFPVAGAARFRDMLAKVADIDASLGVGQRSESRPVDEEGRCVMLRSWWFAVCLCSAEACTLQAGTPALREHHH